jgi:hypothetical protein
MQVSPVTLSCPSPWLHPVCCYKRPLKEEEGLLFFAALLWAFFGVGSFWKGGVKLLKGKLAEEKRIVEGKMVKEKCR